MTNSEQEWRTIQLTDQEATNPDLLVAPSKRYLGGTPDIAKRNVEIRIGARPTALDLRRVYEQSGKAIPKDFELYASYRIWLISHHVGIARRAGVEFVNRFSYEVKFADKSRVTVLGLFPETRFVKRGGVDASAKVVAGIDLKGEAVVPPIDVGADGAAPISLSGNGDGKLEVSGKVGLVGQLSFSVMTAAVVAVGVGDVYSQWAFERDDRPLIGDQMMSQTVLVPKNIERLDFDVKVSATISTFDLLPSRRASQWLTINATLPRRA
jgi:hypothetical protein